MDLENGSTKPAADATSTASVGRKILNLLAVIAVFYVSGALTVVALQQLMQTHPYPFLWCLNQFVFSYVMAAIYFWLKGDVLKCPSITPGAALVAAVCYTLGLVFSNIALEYGKSTSSVLDCLLPDSVTYTGTCFHTCMQ